MNIELQGVSKRYGEVSALDRIDLTIAPGERVGLIGPNGSGKSTLVRAIMGIVRCEGLVSLDGLDPFADRTRLAGRVSCVPQAAPQLGATVGDVVAAVAALRRLDVGDIRETARAMGLDVQAVRGRPVRALSGGTRQKLLIALALAGPMSLLILDEPTASLDAGSREAFFRLSQARIGSGTLLLSSHRLEEVRRLVDRVVALEDGRVVLDIPAGDPSLAGRFGAGAADPRGPALALGSAEGRLRA